MDQPLQTDTQRPGALDRAELRHGLDTALNLLDFGIPTVVWRPLAEVSPDAS